jgi:hypothetical protein
MMHRFLFLIIGSFAILLAGCSSIERLDNSNVSALGQISVKTGASRSDQIFRQHIIRFLDRHSAQDIRYRLKTRISESQSDTAVSMKIAFELYDQTRGEAVLSDSINLSATFGAVSSLYGQDKAATFSSERLAMQLSDKVYLKLLAYFNNLENAGTASAE